VGVALLRVEHALLTESAWIEVQAVAKGLRSETHEVWLIVARVHGFARMDEVRLADMPVGARVFGSTIVRDVEPQGTARFSVALPLEPGEQIVTVEAMRNGRSVRSRAVVVRHE
jgi:hypothetical protein